MTTISTLLIIFTLISVSNTSYVSNDDLKFEPNFHTIPRFEPGINARNLEAGYPLSAAWFKDRYSRKDWDQTLQQFGDIGGEIVILRAPSIVSQTREEFLIDPNYQWCKVRRPFGYISCYDDAMEELSALRLHVVAVAKYDYEENYNVKNMIRCPNYERSLNTSRTYFRLVFSMDNVTNRDPCNLNGSRVMVLFTSFAGIDPHQLLLQSAHAQNMSVYFGLPQLPTIYTGTNAVHNLYYTEPLLRLTRRILSDHRFRYSEDKTQNNIYSSLVGYFYSSEIQLNGKFATDSAYLTHLYDVGESIQSFNKSFAVSTFYQSNKLYSQALMYEFLDGSSNLVRTGVIDVISAKDGRGSGNGAYYWQTQLDSSITQTDPTLYKILTDIDPSITTNTSFSALFSFSMQQLFYNLAVTRDTLSKNGSDVELWLNMEAFDNLHDDPCLPVDKAGSGISHVTNRVTKARLDHVLTHVGAYIRRVAVDAWDPCFTCMASYNSTLARRVEADNSRPIIANCSFHSSFNRSVVVIGYNLAGETQSFMVSWPNVHGQRQTSKVYGYYFELDWGIAHDRVPTLMYTQLYDPYDVIELAPRGWVRVSVDGGYNSCTFVYDFDRETNTRSEWAAKSYLKKHYLRVQHPKTRIYAQDVPFSFHSREKPFHK